MSDNRARYDMTCEVEVSIYVDEDYEDEWGGLLDPRRMEGIYDLEDRDEMLRHLAFNAVMNGCDTAKRLDGWLVPRELLEMELDRWSFEVAWGPTRQDGDHDE